jgi:hypothetical protein
MSAKGGERTFLLLRSIVFAELREHGFFCRDTDFGAPEAFRLTT